MAFTHLSSAWRGAHRTEQSLGGVLLCHGFTGSPQSMRPWGEHLADRGWDVSIPLLPGHGTRWQDLAATDRRAWVQALADELRRCADIHSTVALGGLSMGGALTLALAEDPQLAPRISALMLVNPALRLRPAQALGVPVLRHLIPSVGSIASDTRSGAQEEAYARTPLHAVDQLRRLQREVRASLEHVTAPVFLATSTEDHVVDTRCSDLVARRVRGRVERMALTDSFHVATLDREADRLFAASADFLVRIVRR